MKFAAAPPAGIDPTKSQIPVILLIFNHEKGEILKQVREIFVDINKTARPVSRQRAILLDDRDIFAILARDLVQDEMSNADGLPYEVVDWRRESLKPDAPHQLTSLLVLYQCVERLFSNRVGTVDGYLQVNDALRGQRLRSLNLKIRECVVTNKQAEVLLDRFRPRHKQFILAVFRNLDPFKTFLDLFRKYVDSPNGSYLKEYFFKPDSKKEAVRDRMRKKGVDDKAVIDAAIADLNAHKTSDNLLFYSIGQRSLFHWFYRVYALYRALLSKVNLEPISDAYVEDINFLNKLGFFNRDFKVNDSLVWEGLCTRLGRIIASSSSAERIGALTLLAITTLRLGQNQTIEENIPDLQKIAYKKLLKVLEPIMQMEDEEEGEEEGELEAGYEEADEDDLEYEEEFHDVDVRSRPERGCWTSSAGWQTKKSPSSRKGRKKADIRWRRTWPRQAGKGAGDSLTSTIGDGTKSEL